MILNKKLKIIIDKIEMGDIQEDEYQKIMDEEFPDTIGWGF